MIRRSCGSKSFEFSEGMETVGVDGSSCWPVPEASWLYSVVLRLLRTSVCWGWGMLKAPFTSKNLVSSFQLYKGSEVFMDFLDRSRHVVVCSLPLHLDNPGVSLTIMNS